MLLKIPRGLWLLIIAVQASLIQVWEINSCLRGGGRGLQQVQQHKSTLLKERHSVQLHLCLNLYRSITLQSVFLLYEALLQTFIPERCAVIIDLLVYFQDQCRRLSLWGRFTGLCILTLSSTVWEFCSRNTGILNAPLYPVSCKFLEAKMHPSKDKLFPRWGSTLWFQSNPTEDVAVQNVPGTTTHAFFIKRQIMESSAELR